jgi:hypothetical protein
MKSNPTINAMIVALGTTGSLKLPWEREKVFL